MHTQEPSPSGWYRDPYGADARFFDGDTWTSETSNDERLMLLTMPPTPTAPTQPRLFLGRIVIMVVIVFVLAAPGVFVRMAVGSIIGDLRWADPLALNDWSQILWPALAMAIVGPHISYRRRDWPLMLIPIYGWYLMFVIGWRLAYLAYRDWSPRPDESASWQQLRHPIHPGVLLYRIRPTGFSVP